MHAAQRCATRTLVISQNKSLLVVTTRNNGRKGVHIGADVEVGQIIT